MKDPFRLGLAVGALGTFLSALLVALGVNILVPWISDLFWPAPDPRPVQLEQIRRSVSERGAQTLFAREADLHGTGEQSQILLVRSPSGEVELLIHDVVDGWFRNALKFQPGTLRPRKWTQQGRYGMQVVGLSDFDDDGTEELVVVLAPSWQNKRDAGLELLRRGVVERLGIGRPDMQIPVLVRWIHGAGRYSVQPLIPRRPQYPIVPFKGPQRRARSDFYRRPYWLADPASRRLRLAYGAEVVRVMIGPGNRAFLLSGYPARWGVHSGGPYGFAYTPEPRCEGTTQYRSGTTVAVGCGYAFGATASSQPGPDVMSLVAARIDPLGDPLVRRCTAGGTFFIDTGLDPEQAIERAWPRLVRRSAC